MKKSIWLLFSLASLIGASLTGCSTRQSESRSLDQFLGKDEASLTAELGEPASTLRDNSGSLTLSFKGSLPAAMPFLDIPSRRNVFGVQTHRSSSTVTKDDPDCILSFTLDENGLVKAYDRSEPDCEP